MATKQAACSNNSVIFLGSGVEIMRRVGRDHVDMSTVRGWVGVTIYPPGSTQHSLSKSSCCTSDFPSHGSVARVPVGIPAYFHKIKVYNKTKLIFLCVRFRGKSAKHFITWLFCHSFSFVHKARLSRHSYLVSVHHRSFDIFLYYPKTSRHFFLPP